MPHLLRKWKCRVHYRVHLYYKTKAPRCPDSTVGSRGYYETGLCCFVWCKLKPGAAKYD